MQEEVEEVVLELEEEVEEEDGLVLPRSDLKTVIGWWDSI